jgi:hypothetical protein
MNLALSLPRPSVVAGARLLGWLPSTSNRKGVNLTQASREWASRPADERFGSIAEWCAAAKARADSSRECAAQQLRDFHVKIDSEGNARLAMKGQTATASAALTNWSAGQLGRIIHAPMGYVATLTDMLAEQCLNEGIANSDTTVAPYLGKNGRLHVRALTTETYERIQDADVAPRLQALASDGWKAPPARPAVDGQPGSRLATAEDVGGWTSVQIGERIAPAGLYAGDRDSFVFLCDTQHPITDPQGNPIYRGMFVKNSEVGASSLQVTGFYYRLSCGNHIVWDADNITTVKIRHVGDANRRWANVVADLRRYCVGSTGRLEAAMQSSARFRLAESKDALLDWLFKREFASRKEAEIIHTIAIEHADLDGDPMSAWGTAQAMTRLSQMAPTADVRLRFDEEAGRLLAGVN